MLGVKLNVKKSKVKIAVINNAEKSGKKALRGGGGRGGGSKPFILGGFILNLGHHAQVSLVIG